jgi:glycosyltransferase involved in cell wall biosynthesis
LRKGLDKLVKQEKLGDLISLMPPMPPARVAEEMHEFDALVLPSRTTRLWKEQFGRVLIEAMACKVPVVASDSGAIPEVVGDAGLIFPEGDAQALADCLQRLMDSPELSQELAERGHARVLEHYTQVQIAAQTAAFYRELVRT